MTLQDCEEAVCQQNEPSMNANIPTKIADLIENFNDVFINSMSEDLHSADVLCAIFDPLRTANDLLHTRKVALQAAHHHIVGKLGMQLHKLSHEPIMTSVLPLSNRGTFHSTQTKGNIRVIYSKRQAKQQRQRVGQESANKAIGFIQNWRSWEFDPNFGPSFSQVRMLKMAGT